MKRHVLPRLPPAKHASSGNRFCLGTHCALVACLLLLGGASGTQAWGQALPAQLIGQGVVTGLAGTGDLDPPINTLVPGWPLAPGAGVRPRLGRANSARVVVTARLPPFVGRGQRVDVDVAAIGGAVSLRGGLLLPTPLEGADGTVYAVASGSIAVGGFAASGAGQTVVQGVATHGRIISGAVVEVAATGDAGAGTASTGTPPVPGPPAASGGRARVLPFSVSAGGVSVRVSEAAGASSNLPLQVSVTQRGQASPFVAALQATVAALVARLQEAGLSPERIDRVLESAEAAGALVGGGR